MLRLPLGPSIWMVASRAVRATFWSEGFEAMQSLLVPRMASMRLWPSMAEQPVPGSRLLHGWTMSRK